MNRATRPRELEGMEREAVAVEGEMTRARRVLEKLERGLRAMNVEAQAARDPRQFSLALRQRWRPGAIAGPVGFCMGLGVGTALTILIATLLRG
jgi:hypothetical protein